LVQGVKALWRYPEIDPVAFALGPVTIYWYGLMYVAGFAGGLGLGLFRAKKSPLWNRDRVLDLLFYVAVGLVLGARIGYMLFYDFYGFMAQPWQLVILWRGGMSFHGGLIGVILAMLWCTRRSGLRFFQAADFVAPLAPVGLFTGRIGNFINNELWGNVTDSPLGMWVYDPQIGDMVRKYPTQLWEAMLEGLILFAILWSYTSKQRPEGAPAGLFLFFYGIFRFFVEFFRAPDPQLGYLAEGWGTMGQVLSLPMVAMGAGIIIWACLRNTQDVHPASIS
jgi:phosphatidylglycerol---prolipoprotein diacylglyceryl transferase